METAPMATEGEVLQASPSDTLETAGEAIATPVVEAPAVEGN
jgi:hypothetical protein